MKKIKIKIKIGACLLLLSSIAMPTTSMAIPISSTDLWDINSGATMDATSGVMNYRSSWKSDIRDMFGGAFAVIEANNTIFKDYMSPQNVGGSVPAGFTHFVEWSTTSAVTLRSFALHAFNEGMGRRAFNHFALYTGDGVGTWTSIYNASPIYNGTLEIAVNLTPTTAQYFRAEFVQAPWSSSTAVGPRIQELDGFDTFLDGSTGGVPEPATLVLFGLGLAGLGCSRRKTGVSSV